jgi:hypothetical protein
MSSSISQSPISLRYLRLRSSSTTSWKIADKSSSIDIYLDRLAFIPVDMQRSIIPLPEAPSISLSAKEDPNLTKAADLPGGGGL